MTSKRFQTPDHLRSFIKVQQIKSELNDVIISNSMNEILKLLGSKSNLLHFIVKYVSKDQLDGIYTILQKEIQQFEIFQSNKDSKSPSISHSEPLISVQSHFNTISCESIENICAFLSRDDIKSFKGTSRRISIVALNEMSKYLMNVCIAKKLLYSKQTKMITWRADNTSQHKYKIPPTFASVFEEIQTTYLIPKQQQIPITIAKYDQISTHTINEKIPPKSSLIVFDKNDITILNSESSKQMTNVDVFPDNNHMLLTLHYFDIHKQEITMIKHLIIHYSERIEVVAEYIKDRLIKEDNSGTLDTLEELMNEDCSLRLFRLDRQSVNAYSTGSYSSEYMHSDPIIPRPTLSQNLKVISLVFQIDATHIQSLKTLQLESESTLLRKVFLNVSKFLKHPNQTANIKFSFERESKENITDYMVTNNIFSEKSQNDIFEEMDKLCRSEAIVCDSELNFDAIKRYLSKTVMNNIIPLEYIMCRNFHLRSYDTTQLRIGVKASKYKIQIYSKSQAPFPFTYHQLTSEQMKPILTTKIYINNEDTVHDVVQHLYNDAPNLFADTFNEIMPSFDEYFNSVSPSCYALFNGCSNPIIYQPNNNISSYELRRTDYIKLFFLPFQNQHQTRTIKLQIRFVCSSNKKVTAKANATELSKEYLGFPLIVFINKRDTLQYVFMNNDALTKYQRSIFHVYKVDFDQHKVTSIPQSKRNQYNLWSNVVSKNSKNFIVIKLKNRSDSTMHANQYGLGCAELLRNNTN